MEELSDFFLEIMHDVATLLWSKNQHNLGAVHTYPDMYKVAGQIINLDNFCEAAFLCLFDTSTSILIPLYIWEDRRKTLSSQFTCQKRGQKFMNVNFKKNQKYSWPFGFGLWVARLQIKDLLHYETRCVLSNCLPVKMGSCRVCNLKIFPTMRQDVAF